MNFQVYFSSGRKLTVDCMYAGVNLTPSTSIVTGANKKKDMTVIMEKRVMLSMDSCSKQSID